MKQPYMVLCAALLLVLGLVGCDYRPSTWFAKPTGAPAASQTQQDEGEEMSAASDGKAAKGKDQVTVDLLGTQGAKIGHVQLTQTPKGVRFEVQAAGVTPGEHGFHVHETGKCASPDFASAGGHFNPGGHEHGLGKEKGPHAGDLPNLRADASGNVKADFTVNTVTLSGGKPNSLFKTGGTALVIHANPDDNQSQPSGNSGARIACGAVEPAL